MPATLAGTGGPGSDGHRATRTARLGPPRRAGLAASSGWLLVIVGLALIPLPGPGSIIAVAGLRQLAPRYEWAARLYAPAQERVVRAARHSVATWPRVAVTALGPAWLTALTIAYLVELRIPRVAIAGTSVGPELPLQSTGSALGLAVSAVVCLALVTWTVLAWGPVRRRTPHPRVAPDVNAGSGAG